jgi:hypothetical protein
MAVLDIKVYYPEHVIFMFYRDAVMPVRLKTLIGSFMLFIAGSLIYACGALGGPSAEASAHRHLGTNLLVRLEKFFSATRTSLSFFIDENILPCSVC